VQVVAEGRDTTAAHVREIGEGRIYSGRDGQRVGLVDEIGGLARAITVAQDAAGLAGENVEITEVNPTTGLFGLPPFVPGALARLWSDDAPEVAVPLAQDPLAQDDALQFLRTVLQHQPRPVALLPPGYYPSNAEFGPSRAEFGTAD